IFVKITAKDRSARNFRGNHRPQRKSRQARHPFPPNRSTPLETSLGRRHRQALIYINRPLAQLQALFI
ncbi:hypothetical protein M5D96_001349, partial [Drosophila gunungcola]